VSVEFTDVKIVYKIGLVMAPRRLSDNGVWLFHFARQLCRKRCRIRRKLLLFTNRKSHRSIVSIVTKIVELEQP